MESKTLRKQARRGTPASAQSAELRPAESALNELYHAITSCELCPRLRKYCKNIAEVKRKSYADQEYWGKPVHGFGDPAARLVIVGLAPAAHGANRTGRIFTGDRSGEWLYRALHRAGYANQSEAVSRDDGLQLRDAYITCVARCAPPDNKPSPAEIARCAPYLEEELSILRYARVYLALGQIGLSGMWPFVSAMCASGSAGAAGPPGVAGREVEPKSTGRKSRTSDAKPARLPPRPKFSHGGKFDLGGGRWLLMSYHPSQQNTFTGRLTEPMFDSVFTEANRILGRNGRK